MIVKLKEDIVKDSSRRFPLGLKNNFFLWSSFFSSRTGVWLFSWNCGGKIFKSYSPPTHYKIKTKLMFPSIIPKKGTKSSETTGKEEKKGIIISRAWKLRSFKLTISFSTGNTLHYDLCYSLRRDGSCVKLKESMRY